MHNVAIDLKDLGHSVSGSDDEIYNPSRERLAAKGLLPASMGWDSQRITEDIDAIILGKHAREDNPELIRAQELNLPIYSFPEYVKLNTKARQRVCVAGSHGKTSTTAMIMHVLKKASLDFDYLVGAKLEGFDKMVKLSNANIIIIEADEYPSSCIDMRAKMLHYKPNISIITGLAWDHVNIYRTYEDYKDVFRTFLTQMNDASVCFFDHTDEDLLRMMTDEAFEVKRESYGPFPIDKKGALQFEGDTFPIQIFGRHNMLNLHAAFKVCVELGLEPTFVLEALGDFTGASKRLELLHEDRDLVVYKDFAHAPSKCKATVEAVRSKYNSKKITAVYELHTFSSLTPEFIEGYAHSMEKADSAVVFFDPKALEIKRMEALDKDFVHRAFKHNNLKVVNDRESLEALMQSAKAESDVLLIMSSGNLGGIDVNNLF